MLSLRLPDGYAISVAGSRWRPLLQSQVPTIMSHALSIFSDAPLLFADGKLEDIVPWVLFAIVFGVLFVIVVLVVAFSYGKLWFQAYMSNARVSLWNLIGMRLRNVDPRVIVHAKIIAMQRRIASLPDAELPAPAVTA